MTNELKKSCTDQQIKTLVYRYEGLMTGLRDRNDILIKHSAIGLRDMQTETGVYVFPQSDLVNLIYNRGGE